MSDAIWVALIMGPALAILNHYLGRRDRALAANTVVAKNTEIEELKAAHAKEVGELRATIAKQATQLAEAGITPC